MPTIKQSVGIDRSRLQPTPPMSAEVPAHFIGYVPPATAVQDARMQGSLPPMISGADVYTRQFYRGGPRQRRFIPIPV
jgi:hypothetical protein